MDTKPAFRRRRIVLVLALAAGAFVLGGAFVSRAQIGAANQNQAETVGAFALPNLSGWHKKYTRHLPRKVKYTRRGVTKLLPVPLREAVVYEKTVDGATISLSFDVIFSNCPVTRADVEAGLRAAETITAAMPPSKTKETATVWKAVSFHGLPTYERTSSLIDIKGCLVESRERNFCKGNALYTQDLTVRGAASGATIPASARKEAGRVWEAFARRFYVKTGRTIAPDTSVEQKRPN